MKLDLADLEEPKLNLHPQESTWNSHIEDLDGNNLLRAPFGRPIYCCKPSSAYHEIEVIIHVFGEPITLLR